MKDRPGYRSYSQLTEYMKCGESFRLSRRVGVKEQPSVWLPGGTAFHNTTERYDLGTMNGMSITSVFVDEWNRAVAEQTDRAPAGYEDPSTWRVAGKGKESIDWWLTNAPKWCEAYVAWREASNLQLVEHGVEAELMPELSGVLVKMYPDRIFVDEYGQALIVDLKTGSSDQPSSLQLGVYRVGVAKLTGLDAEWGAFYSARKGKLDPPVKIDHWTEERIGQLFHVFDQQERAGQYLPNIGSHCKYMCSVRNWCVYQGGTKHEDDL
jgi:hypothetical protein